MRSLQSSKNSIRPLALYLLIALLTLLGVTAGYGGFNLVADPSGARLQMPLAFLERSPFHDYLIPGIILLIVLGVASLVTALALWLQPHWAIANELERLIHQHWAWTLTVTIGFALVIWIIVQLTMMPYFFLQPVMLIWGLMIVGLAFLPTVRHYYAR